MSFDEWKLEEQNRIQNLNFNDLVDEITEFVLSDVELTDPVRFTQDILDEEFVKRLHSSI